MTRLKTGSVPLAHLQLKLGWNTALSCSHPAWLSSVIPSLKLPDISACWVLGYLFMFFYSFDMCSGLQYVSVWVAVTVIIPRTIFLVNSSRKCFLFLDRLVVLSSFAFLTPQSSNATHSPVSSAWNTLTERVRNWIGWTILFSRLYISVEITWMLVKRSDS